MFAAVLPRDCAAEILLIGALGALSGFALSGPDNPSSSEVSAVVAARYYADHVESSTVPGLPRSMFLAIVASLYPLLKGWCPGFLSDHLLFAANLIICGISCGFWLLAAAGIQKNIDRERKARIEHFVSDGAASVPEPVAGLRTYDWLMRWNWVNVALFLLILGTVVISLVTGPPISLPWNS